MQAAAETNLPAVRGALSSNPAVDTAVELVPGVNHLFQKATTGGIDEYEAME